MDEQELYLRNRVKVELRRRIRAIRKVLPAAAKAARSAKLAERVLAHPEIRSARCVAGFVAIRNEVDPTAILEGVRASGAGICLPRVDLELGAIVLHAHGEGDVLEEGGFGVPEPSVDAPRVKLEDVDVVLVPGLAFDPRGHRIGYGKGYYDQLLPTLPNAHRIAVGYDFQVVAEVPNLDHDVPVNAVITDARTFLVDHG